MRVYKVQFDAALIAGRLRFVVLTMDVVGLVCEYSVNR